MKDGGSVEVEADEVLFDGATRFVCNALDSAGDERYTDVLILAPGVWTHIEAADAGLKVTPSPPPRIA
ncbi:hypothetical protein AWB92_24815 [Mycobacterium sp. IEC1808]|uniref:hypothetical protein n=1 Tax=Mycobacterium sp. IEC1808 TaxID=1743230 RepID=UPI000A15FF33|nr:hypothetical protein [Mycobacterium sp. IEC1808]ORW86911.1 hypothetical protein AWB92_24815 [Mycobacterium sp. IEC1808]